MSCCAFTPSRCHIDLAALRRNFARLGEPGSIMPVVKSDAYGHGLLPVARALLDDGTDSLTTRQVRNVTERLKRRVDLPVFYMPELLSSEEAWSDLRDAGLTARKRKAVLDQQAAVRILASFLALPPEQRRPA